MDNLIKVFDFIREIEALKAVERKTRPIGLQRFENSAEHSWHICLTALMLKDHANAEVNIDRVIKMLLIHDLGEIDAGDVIVYASDNEDYKAAEAQGLRRVMSLLPEQKAAEFIALWEEFEQGDTADSRFAKAVDRIPPVLQNLDGNLHGWKAHSISVDQVLEVNSRIGKGSQPAWDYLRPRIIQAFDEMERHSAQ